MNWKVPLMDLPRHASGGGVGGVPQVAGVRVMPHPDPSALSERTYIGLGSNLESPLAQLRAARRGLQALRAGPLPLELVGVSGLYRSAPVQAQGPDFLNAVACLEWRGPGSGPDSHELLQALQGLEQGQGRRRPYPNAPRTLDLDILLIGRRLIDTPELKVPHPRALERAFVLRPLLDLCPDLHWPPAGAPWAELLQAVSGQSLRRLDDPDWAVLPLPEHRTP